MYNYIACVYMSVHLFIYFPLYFSYQEVFHRFDKDQSGLMKLVELRDALSALGKTVAVFILLKICIDFSLFILHEFDFYLCFFANASSSVGYKLNNTALSSIHVQYHNKKGTIPFDIFIQILMRVIVMFGKLNPPI